MNFRQFLLRGLKKADLELRWMATAYHLVKILRFKASAALKTVPGDWSPAATVPNPMA